jgi:hypothetical protein
MKGAHGPALEQFLLAREQQVPHPVILGREALPMLRDRPVGRDAGRRRRTGLVGGAIGDELVGEHRVFSKKKTPPGAVPDGVDDRAWFSARQSGPARARAVAIINSGRACGGTWADGQAAAEHGGHWSRPELPVNDGRLAARRWRILRS